MIERLKKIFSRKVAIEPTMLKFFMKLLVVFLVFVLALVVLGTIGVNIAPILAFGSIGAAAIGIASKNFIANCFGGFVFNMTRPFSVGDLIELPHKKITGYVEEIGWTTTQIRDLQKQPLFIPNSLFSNEVLINQSKRSHRRIEEMLVLRIEGAEVAEGLAGAIQRYLESDPRIDAAQPLYVHTATFAQGAMNLEIKAYTHATSYGEFMQVKQSALLRIYEIVKKSGAEFSTPLVAVHTP